MTAQELIAALRPDNPGRRFAVAYYVDWDGQRKESAIAIDCPNGGWEMFAGATTIGTWGLVRIRSIEERNEWEEVTCNA